MISTMLRRHGAAVALALVSGAILWLPHARRGDRAPYLQGDEWKEAVNIEAIRAGHWQFSELYVFEHRDSPWPYPRLPYWICAVPAFALDGAEPLFSATDAVLPPVLFLLLYSLLVRVGVRPLLAAWVCVVYVLHHSDLYSILEPMTRHGVAATLNWYARPFHYDSIFAAGSYTIARFPFPLASLILLVGFLHALAWAIEKRRAVAIGAAGLLLALITYVRFFDWMILYPALVAAGVLCGRREAARTIGLVVAVGLLVSLPYLVPAMSHSSDPASAATLEHNGLERTHRLFPDPLRAVYPTGPICLLGLLIAAALSRAASPLRTAFTAAAVGFVPACTFQVLTGWTVAPDHWFRDHVLPFATAAAAFGVGWALLRWRFGATALAILTALSVAHAGGLYGYYRLPESDPHGEFKEALSRVEPDAVVLGWEPERIKTLAPRAWSFLGSGPRSPVPTEELLMRYLIALKLFGRDDAPPALFEPGFHGDLWSLVGGETYVHYRRPSGLSQGRIESIHLPIEEQTRWLDFYASIDGTGGRRLDYILTIDDPRPEWGPPIYEGKSVRLYRYR